jgi:hypothetical protein
LPSGQHQCDNLGHHHVQATGDPCGEKGNLCPVGALEAKELFVLSEWAMESCEAFAAEDSKTGSQLEATLP